MVRDLVHFLCLAMMLVAMVTSIARWSILQKQDRIISFLLVVTILSEAVAYFFTVRYSNNMYVYHIFSPIELSFIAFYYSRAVPFLKKNHIGIIVTILGFAFAILNAVKYQPIKTFPSIFLLFEGFLIIVLSVLSFFSILYKDDFTLTRNSQFWITFNLLFFWSFTFLIWGTYISFAHSFRNKLPVIFSMLSAINFIEYLSFFLIFLFYPKMNTQGE